MAKMLHENWEDLAYFARALNDEMLLQNGLVKDAYRHTNPLLTEALRQFMIEVEYFGDNSTGQYGDKHTKLGLGISHMDAETWFNDDVVRKNWSNIIAETYEKYQKAITTDGEVTFSPVSEELKAMENKLDSAMAQLAKLQEAMSASAMSNAMSDKEEATEKTDTPEEEDKEDESGKPKEGK